MRLKLKKFEKTVMTKSKAAILLLEFKLNIFTSNFEVFIGHKKAYIENCGENYLNFGT